VLDACRTFDLKGKIACETVAKDNLVIVAGESTSEAKPDYDNIERGVVKQVDFESYVDDLSSGDVDMGPGRGAVLGLAEVRARDWHRLRRIDCDLQQHHDRALHPESVHLA
jgi:hypothetical protein